MEKINLSPEQRATLKAEFEAEEKVKKEQVASEREQYKLMVDGFVTNGVKKLQALSSQMQVIKREIFEEAETLIEIKNELYKTKSDRRSDTFSSLDNKMSITLGDRKGEGWDDTVNEGVAKVKEYLTTLARDDEAAMLYEGMMGLLAKDRKGNLKANKVLELEKMATKCQNPVFWDGLEIIKGAYRPSLSCQFIEVKLKDDKGNEVNLPLSLAAMK